MSWFRWDGDDLLISLYVQPKASRAEIVGPHNDALKIRVTAPPEAGRANSQIVGLLAGRFGVSRSAVTLERGAGGRNKRVRIVTPDRLPPLPGLAKPGKRAKGQ